MNFAFYVSKSGSRLKKFSLKYKQDNLINHIKFVLIDNTKNKELIKLCQALQISYYEVDLMNQQNKNEYISDYFVNKLVLHEIDYAFIVCDKILKGEILSQYKIIIM